MRIREILVALLLTAWLGGCENQPDWQGQWQKFWNKDKGAAADKPAAGTASGVSSSAAPAPVADKPASKPAADVLDPRAIKINDRKVTVADILKSADADLKKIGKPAGEKEFVAAARPILVRHRNRLVAEMLLYGAAERGMNDQARKHLDDEVKDAQQRWLSEVGGSKVRLREELAKKGMTLDDALTQYRRGATIHLYLQDQLAPRVTITRDTLLQYYAEHDSEFRQAQKVQMQIIEAPWEAFLPSPLSNPTAEEAQAAKDEARKTIRQAAAAVVRGEEFGAVAERLSRGVKRAEKGIWPPMEAGSFKQEAVSKAAFSQPEGAVSGIIETPDGFYIVKTRKIFPGKVELFDDVQTKIEARIRQDQMERLTREHIAELEDRAAITEPRGFVDTLVNQAVRTYFGPGEPKPLNPEPVRRP